MKMVVTDLFDGKEEHQRPGYEYLMIIFTVKAYIQ